MTTMVFAGPDERSRGCEDLIRAVRRLPGTHPLQVVALLRDPSAPELSVTRVREGVHEVIRVRGFVTQDELRGLYGLSHLGVFPYRFVRTALPLVPLEAAAAGLPVVTTRVHPLRELEDRTGLVFADPGRPRSIASAIEEALDPEKRAALVRRNQTWIQEALTWRDVAARFASLLRG